MNASYNGFRPIDIAYTAMAVALISICAWIQIPTTVPFTLQTFAIFLIVYLLGGVRGTMAVLVYILLGTIGAPVFAGGNGGPGALLSASGGYIIGFLFSAFTIWGCNALAEKLFAGRIRTQMQRSVKKSVLLLIPNIVSMLLGLLVCYAFGTIWFVQVYVTDSGSHVTYLAALSWCVFPFIVPDLLKIGLALVIGSNRALRRVIGLDHLQEKPLSKKKIVG